MLFLKGFEVKCKIKFIDISTVFEIFALVFDPGKVLRHTFLDGLAHLWVFEGFVNYGAESGTRVGDKTMDEVMEILVIYYTLHFFSHSLHVRQQLFKVVLELNFGRLKLETQALVIHVVVFKSDCSLNWIFL